MAKILLKGLQEQFVVTPEEAERARIVFDDSTKSGTTKIIFKNFSTTKDNIKTIIAYEDQDQKDKQKNLDEEQTTRLMDMDRKAIKARLSLPIIERAKILDEFKIYCNIVCEEQPTKEQLLEVARIQHEYYKQNPQHAFCPIKKWADVVKATTKYKLNIIESNVLKILDMHMSR